MIDRGTCKAMLRESARLMLEQADRLSDIDSKFGDGDHGITITNRYVSGCRVWQG